MKLREVKRYIGIIAFLLFLLPQTVCGQETGHPSKKSFLWEIQSPTTTVYLLGSIHLMKPDMYPLDPVIESAFDNAAYLVVEVNPLTVDTKKVQNEIMLNGMFSGDKTIQDVLSDEVFSMLKAHLETMNIPIANFMKFKPGVIVMTLANIQLMQLGFSPEYGIDMHFIRKAQGERPILELETIDKQMALLLDNSLNDSLVLKSSILEWEQTKDTMDKVIMLWKEGNADQMNQLIIQEPLRKHSELRPVYQKMFFDRNKEMTTRIKQFLETEETYFVVVGSGHLIGDKGIVRLLTDAGYLVKQR